jgi:hypothetical protein
MRALPKVINRLPFADLSLRKILVTFSPLFLPARQDFADFVR